MAKIADLTARRRAHTPRPGRGRFVVCAHCGERHPIIRLSSGDRQCVTAFHDRGRWFCRNRGCRAAWLERSEKDGPHD